MNEFISSVSILLAAACWALISHYTFHNTSKDPFSFWGSESYKRKYKNSTYSDYAYSLLAAPENWYYKFFKLKYREKFPLSATVFVFLTDGYHLMQWIGIKFIMLAVAIHSDRPVLAFFIYWALWLLGFNGVYLYKKKT